MPSSLLTMKQKISQCQLLAKDIAQSNSYYFFAGNIFVSNAIPEALDTTFQTSIAPYQNMLIGKAIANTDVALAVPYIPYQTDTVYTAYDDQQELYGNNFYSIVSESSYYHLFKCLNNNFGNPSTVSPDFSVVANSNISVFQTSDNYTWKYMYSVSNSQFNKFASATYFPVIANTTIQAQAVAGSFDVIAIDNPGQRYDNYITGQFGGADLRINGNTQLFNISNTMASVVNNFYTGCLMYISSGSGAGAFCNIVNYICTTNGNFIVTDSALPALTNGSRYEIYPAVNVVGDGNQTVNVVARALVNALSSNSIYSIDIIKGGQNYTFATANVIYNATVPVQTPTVIRPIYAPPGGHGADAPTELGAQQIVISTSFQNSESNTIFTTNDYNQIGLLNTPLFANVYINHATTNGTFLVGETVAAISPIRIGTGTINTTSAVLTLTSSDIRTTIPANALLYLELQDGSNQQLALVNSVVNSTSLTLTSNANFQNTVNVFLANTLGTAVVTSPFDVNHVYITNVNPVFVSNVTFIGFGSGKKATVNTVSRNGVTKGFGTFLQTFKYTGNMVAGQFVQGEKLQQNGKTAYVHSVVGNTSITLYTTNCVGIFDSSSPIQGLTSMATATISNKYNPELVPFSGDIIYLENISSTNRTGNTETFKISINIDG